MFWLFSLKLTNRISVYGNFLEVKFLVREFRRSISDNSDCPREVVRKIQHLMDISFSDFVESFLFRVEVNLKFHLLNQIYKMRLCDSREIVNLPCSVIFLPCSQRICKPNPGKCRSCCPPEGSHPSCCGACNPRSLYSFPSPRWLCRLLCLPEMFQWRGRTSWLEGMESRKQTAGIWS